MGYRKVSAIQARGMAKAAGLDKGQIRRCHFHEEMAEHAAQLIIAWTVKSATRGRSSLACPKRKRNAA